MRFTIEGREYDWEQKLTVEEAMFVQDKAHLGMSELDAELNRGNPYAVTALIFLGKKRAGEAVRWQDLMGLDLLTFQRMPDKPIEDEPIGDAAPEPRADPTLPDGTTPPEGTTAT